MIRLIHGDCLDLIDAMGRVKTIWSDIPDNLGIKYDAYDDNLKPEQYFNWVELLILKSLPKCDIFWLSYYGKNDLEIKNRIRNILKYKHPAFTCDTFIWSYTFSQYNDNDCSYGYRPIARLMVNGAKLHVDAIREESARMIIGDKRAAGPRVPCNVFEFPRVVGNSKERRSFHPNQHPEKLMERIIKMSCDPSEEFVDMFTGTGTSLRVCKRLGIPHTSFEISKNYCHHIAQENNIEFFTPNLVM